MAKEKAKRTTGLKWFVHTLLHGDMVEVEEAFRKEASRQTGEMVKWMQNQHDFDPDGMLFEYEETLFPVIDKAVKYQARIYNRNKLIKKAKQALIDAQAEGATVDPADLAVHKERIAELQEAWSVIQDEQMALAWRIRKIYSFVVKQIRLDLDPGEKDPFEEYEYDTDKL